MNIISKQIFVWVPHFLEGFHLGRANHNKNMYFKKEDQKEREIKLAFILQILGIVSFLQISDRQ